MNGQRWCHACNKAEDFDAGWWEFWADADGRFVCQPVTDPASHHTQFRGDTFACGEGSALVLFERWLHTRTFDVPHYHVALTETPAVLAPTQEEIHVNG